MDITSIGQLKELGIALVAVIGFAYITKYVIDKNGKVFDTLTKQMEEIQKAYSSFVLENNHNNTDRVEKSTEAITKVGQAIEQHTRVLEKLIDKF